MLCEVRTLIFVWVLTFLFFVVQNIHKLRVAPRTRTRIALRLSMPIAVVVVNALA